MGNTQRIFVSYIRFFGVFNCFCKKQNKNTEKGNVALDFAVLPEIYLKVDGK